MDTPTIYHNYRIYHKIGYACMHLRVWTWSIGWAGFYALSKNYLRYSYELFTPFVQKTKQNNNYGMHAMRGVGCWTRWFYWHAYVGEVWPGAWRGTHQTACIWLLSAIQGWLGLPVPIRSLGLPISLPYIYIYTHIYIYIEKHGIKLYHSFIHIKALCLQPSHIIYIKVFT
jgi:hypothetical protein